MATLSHVEYITTDEHDPDTITWLASLLGLGEEWPGDRQFAIVCVTDDGSPIGYLTEDINYARMLEDSLQHGPVDLTAAVTAEKFPINRPGWPGHWMGIDEY